MKKNYSNLPLDRIPVSPPHIPVLDNLDSRPFLSVMIPVFNCARFLPDVLESVLCQDMGPDLMHIEVVDDASTDEDIKLLVEMLGKGRVTYYRQRNNVGSLRNFETCINRAKGELVHILHGDDRVKSGFYNKIEELFQRFPEAGAAFCNFNFIDDLGKVANTQIQEATKDGILDNWFYKIASLQRIQYVAIVVRRSVYERLGSFYGMTYAEDWEMWVRIAKYYPVAYSPVTLAEYRQHLGTISKPLEYNEQIIIDQLHAIKIIESHLPDKDKWIMGHAKKDCAFLCMSIANAVWRQTRNSKHAKSQIKLALSLNKAPIIFYHIIKFRLKVILNIY